MQCNGTFEHHEPITRFATKKGRRMFLLATAGGFSLVLVFFGLTNGLVLPHDPTSVVSWICLLIAVLGLAVFVPLTIGVMRYQLGAKGDVALVLSPVGITDRTQIVGELPMIPWSMIVRYDAVWYYGQAMLLLEVHNPQTFLQHLQSPVMRWAFRLNTKLLKAPIHTITLQHLQDDAQTIAEALSYYSGLQPGASRTGDATNNVNLDCGGSMTRS